MEDIKNILKPDDKPTTGVVQKSIGFGQYLVETGDTTQIARAASGTATAGSIYILVQSDKGPILQNNTGLTEEEMEIIQLDA